MKLLSFIRNEKTYLGLKTEAGIIDLINCPNWPRTMEEAIDMGIKALNTLILPKDVPLLDESELTFAPVVKNPEKIICVGLNYVSHALETGMPIPQIPILFSKFNNALAAHKQIIELPTTASNYDYEAELVIVIGKKTHLISEENAADYIFGFTCGNDLSARDLQMRTSQWLIGKTVDNFAPVGPYITTADVIDGNNLKISITRNGKMCQDSNTNDLIFSVSRIVSYISQYMTLKPGDLIFSGTPSGVILGMPKEKQRWLVAGETLEVTIEGIGTLTNTLV